MQPVLHNGMALSSRLIPTLNSWDQAALTPGWLDSLPDVVAEVCRTWSIDLEYVVPDTNITFVAFGNSTKFGPVVIKSTPLANEFLAESTALRLAAGNHLPRLFDVDRARSIMVMERIVPGTQLVAVPMPDDEATVLAAELARKMWQPVPADSDLHPLSQWMRALFEWSPSSSHVPVDLVEQAQQAGTTLLSRSTRTVLLLGDLQHQNIVQRATGEWVVIDPKGLAGDPGYEVAAWMYNPPGVAMRADYASLVERRAQIFATVWEIDVHELLVWAFVGSVLNACWSSGDAAPDQLLAGLIRGSRELSRLLW